MAVQLDCCGQDQSTSLWLIVQQIHLRIDQLVDSAVEPSSPASTCLRLILSLSAATILLTVATRSIAAGGQRL